MRWLALLATLLGGCGGYYVYSPPVYRTYYQPQPRYYVAPAPATVYTAPQTTTVYGPPAPSAYGAARVVTPLGNVGGAVIVTP